MNRAELQDLSRSRQRESKLLLNSGEWSGAYYIGGYAAECALKACIARRVKRNEFPDRNFGRNVWTHNLVALVTHAGLDPDFRTRISDPKFEVNWSIVKDWSENSRYEVRTELETRDFYGALTARKYGVLPWIRTHW